MAVCAFDCTTDSGNVSSLDDCAIFDHLRHYVNQTLLLYRVKQFQEKYTAITKLYLRRVGMCHKVCISRLLLKSSNNLYLIPNNANYIKQLLEISSRHCRIFIRVVKNAVVACCRLYFSIGHIVEHP